MSVQGDATSSALSPPQLLIAAHCLNALTTHLHRHSRLDHASKAPGSTVPAPTLAPDASAWIIAILRTCNSTSNSGDGNNGSRGTGVDGRGAGTDASGSGVRGNELDALLKAASCTAMHDVRQSARENVRMAGQLAGLQVR